MMNGGNGMIDDGNDECEHEYSENPVSCVYVCSLWYLSHRRSIYHIHAHIHKYRQTDRQTNIEDHIQEDIFT